MTDVSADVEVDVAVVGGGPVGLSTAMELHHHGVTSVVIEPRTTVSYLRPRAKTTSARTMELFRRWDLASAIRTRAPLTIDWARDIVFCTTVTGREVTRLTGTLGLTLAGSDMTAEPGQQVAQPIVEETMRDALATSRYARLMFGQRAVRVEQNEESATVEVVDEDGNRSFVRARWVVGADGPRSVVRDAIGAAYEGSSLPRANVSITFRCPELDGKIPHGDAVQYWVINPALPGIVGRLDLDGTWWAISTARPDDVADNPVDAEHIVLGLLGRDDLPVEIVATDPWHSRTLIADSYRNGRLFIVGDAAHQNPPWGGHGYNTGVGDAINLGWKLAAVVHGWADSALLDSYESERRPIATQFVAAAAENGKTGPTDLAGATAALMGNDAEFAAARPAVAEQIQRDKRIEFHSDGLVFGLGYDGHAEQQTTNGSDYVPLLASGNRLPHRWLADGTSLFDRLGREFTVIGPSADTKVFETLASQRGLPLAAFDPGGELDDVLAGRLVLVRPDQYVAWVGDPVGDDQAGPILDRARRGFE